MNTATARAFTRGARELIRTRSLATDAAPLEKTAFYDLHLSLGGKMVPFAGYELPVQYTGHGVKKEHLHTRAENCASLFDVSHMGQIRWHGKDKVAFIEKMVCGDIEVLNPGEGKLSLIMNESGGIVDDTVISNAGDYIYMVVNGACKHKDMAHFEKYMSEYGMDVQMEYLEDQQLLALQGPGAAAALGRLAPSLDFSTMPFMAGTETEVAGIGACRVTRCGYTGEDGFEISVDYGNAPKLAEALLDQPEVNPCGLGARDSLRLEAGLCLYGNDLDEATNPVEGALTWTIGGPKSRRRQEQGFLGASTFLTPEGKLKKQTRKRIGLAGMKAPAREHTEIFTADGSEKIGEVTSGGFGPTFKAALAIGYVPPAHAKVGTEVAVSVRGKMQSCVVTKMPFTETSYFRVPE
uniref:Aminomethyltransferase n=1 Tax=Octactis speculum TaxID=3111310 RepID=A0A7S2H2M8_9STRA|mmetsp:Transcript_60729/g.83367  ORF Transcript_60729/g.83367 Transcript_60729/m.83367 type:complete len:408 (+) Transcript_60729:74-1297(+)|eukprot:CAMPEP_0185768242 /NCGR_PEP_ID=MMETSP1174-20130828/48456_1 /TAXON_ID=35687 /ORGANISM="Dictyocha speculum, Strain CCMP1381" /LENGTH=407 /DNA_ID=CAMNT_0028452839 /DNA_START=74 /DNA_END=1297 /DNA_ORIENTATION=+